MKRMRAVESDSMKSAGKGKDKLHKTCERGSEICEQTLHRQEQNRLRKVSMRESRGSDRFYNQHTSTITCTVAPRVWHFSAFHCLGSSFPLCRPLKVLISPKRHLIVKMRTTLEHSSLRNQSTLIKRVLATLTLRLLSPANSRYLNSVRYSLIDG